MTPPAAAVVPDVLHPVPDALSARRTFRRAQLFAGGVLLVLVLTAMAWAWKPTLTVLFAAGMAVFTFSITYKATLIWESRRRRTAPRRSLALPWSALPRYTVLVPLYKEANVVAGLVEHLTGMDYPASRLEILLLCEQDDTDTVAAIRALDLPATVRLIIVPEGQPKTKPRACNAGLAVATGDLLVIFDAEDRPEPDQLRVAASVFADSDPAVACLQARLDYHNHRYNWLTRFFANEYNHWFDLLLPALSQRGLPIPLGGTSNHFRVSALRAVAGWDAWNVTEDADLGLRLWVSGFTTDVIDSITWEEACSRTRPWIRQRTRWVKGYLQTFFVHTRDLRWIGARGRPVATATSFAALIAGTPLVNWINPVFWTLFLVHFVTRWHLVVELIPPPILYVGVVNFALGNLLIIAINLMAAQHRQRWHLGRAAALAPLYWLMMSVASWRALYQLVRAPHLWEKTPHGLTPGTAAADPDRSATPARPASTAPLTGARS